MARISGVDIPREKRIEIALTYIFGIGLPSSKKILAATGVDPNIRVKDLSEADVQKLRREIEDHIAGRAPAGPFDCTAKFRYRQPDQAVRVTPRSDTTIAVDFEKLQRAVTPQ